MNDTPTSEELLAAIAHVLTAEVLPNTDGTTRHAVRVAANLCQIVERQLATDDPDATRHALAGLLSCEVGDDIATLLDERLQENNPDFDEAVGDALYADVCRRVDIAKPGYR